MKPFLERIKQGEILVCDGAMGTMLMGRGLKPGECPESLALTWPDLLADIARMYLDAGADILETNTFGASPLKLGLYSLEEKTEAINREAVRILRSVAGDRAYVFACCGPSSALLKPYGDTEPEVVSQSYERQMKALVEEGVDAIILETMTDLTEATLAVRALKSVSPSTPMIATMTFDATPKGFFTTMGVTIEKAAKGLAEAGADLTGSNCGNGIEAMIRIAQEFRKYTTLPLVFQSNAGVPKIQEGRPVYSEGPELMAQRVPELASVGASVIGGCCGTTPEHIRAIRKVVDSLNRARQV
jgi:5-methyltetrahydrofolate--homocysteine methyltransferase